MSDEVQRSRLASYKNSGLGITELRRKRAELSISLRKQARNEQLLKRRALSPEVGSETETEKVWTPNEIVQGLKSSDLTLKTISARGVRRILSREQHPPISVLVNAGVIEPLVNALACDDCPDLQFEAAWAITNIASGSHEHTQAVVDGGAIPKLVSLLSVRGPVAEQSAWALGNISGDGSGTRDAVLAAGALPQLLPFLSPGSPSGVLRTAAWTFSNMCRNKNPLVRFELVSPALPAVAELLVCSDHDVLADVCWALSYLTDGPNERIEVVQGTPQLLPRLIALLQHRAIGVRTPALRAIGNMLTGTDVQTDRVLDAGCLEPLGCLLQCGRLALVKEATWALSNVLAGTTVQIQRALDIGLLKPLVAMLRTDDPKCQKEAAWAITNLCLGGTPKQLDQLFLAGFLESFCALLDGPDQRSVVVVLDGLTHLLKAAHKFGQVDSLCLKLEEIGALDSIETLQQHKNEQVYRKALHILDNFFFDQEEQNPPEHTSEEYQFGANATNATNATNADKNIEF